MNKVIIFTVSTLLIGNCAILTAPQDKQREKLDIEKYIKKAHRNKSWAAQLQTLKASDLLSDRVLYLGVPTDQKVTPKYQSHFLNRLFGNYEKLPKQYFLIKGYEDIEDAFKNNHYEIYFMPEDAYLYDVLKVILDNIRERYFTWARSGKYEGGWGSEFISFIAIRTSPGITRSPFDGKHMPRIIIGMRGNKRGAEEANALLYVLQDAVKEASCIGIPRYSEEFNDSCIFWAYGSVDYKDSKEGKILYEDQKNKAYPSKDYELPTPGWFPDRDLKNQAKNPELKFRRNPEVIYYDVEKKKWYKHSVINGKKTTPTETEQPSMREARKILEAQGIKNPQEILKRYN